MLGRLEYQRGNFDAALQVFQGIDIRSLTPRMIKAIIEKMKEEKPRPKGDNAAPPSGVMSMHSVSLLLEAILLKAKSLEELGRYIGKLLLFIFLPVVLYYILRSLLCNSIMLWYVITMNNAIDIRVSLVYPSDDSDIDHNSFLFIRVCKRVQDNS